MHNNGIPQSTPVQISDVNHELLDDSRSPLANYQDHELIEKRPATTTTKEISELTIDVDDEGRKVRRKRFLWWHLPKKQWILALVGTVLLIVLVLLLILFLAIVPAIFQHFADKVQLSVNHLDLLELPTDPSSREVGVELSLRLKHDTSIKSTMREAKAKLYYGGGVFGEVTIPPQTLEKGAHEFDIVIRDKTEILDSQVFEELSVALM